MIKWIYYQVTKGYEDGRRERESCVLDERASRRTIVRIVYCSTACIKATVLYGRVKINKHWCWIRTVYSLLHVYIVQLAPSLEYKSLVGHGLTLETSRSKGIQEMWCCKVPPLTNGAESRPTDAGAWFPCVPFSELCNLHHLYNAAAMSNVYSCFIIDSSDMNLIKRVSAIVVKIRRKNYYAVHLLCSPSGVFADANKE